MMTMMKFVTGALLLTTCALASFHHPGQPIHKYGAVRGECNDIKKRADLIAYVQGFTKQSLGRAASQFLVMWNGKPGTNILHTGRNHLNSYYISVLKDAIEAKQIETKLTPYEKTKRTLRLQGHKLSNKEKIELEKKLPQLHNKLVSYFTKHWHFGEEESNAPLEHASPSDLGGLVKLYIYKAFQSLRDDTKYQIIRQLLQEGIDSPKSLRMAFAYLRGDTKYMERNVMACKNRKLNNICVQANKTLADMVKLDYRTLIEKDAVVIHNYTKIEEEKLKKKKNVYYFKIGKDKSQFMEFKNCQYQIEPLVRKRKVYALPEWSSREKRGKVTSSTSSWRW